MTTSAYESSAYGSKYITAISPEYLMYGMRLEEEEEAEVEEIELLKKQQRERIERVRKEEQEQGRNLEI
ncbi:MAG TPA: hypothetical protein VNV88_04510 [Candidatus Solibacter sp.]|jgi:hypothetical protein|nr:hypothetical protein [Candidatus Solibacter sp.]